MARLVRLLACIGGMSALVAGLPATGTAQAAPRPAQAVPRPARAVPRPARAGELASPLSLLTGAGNRGELFGVKILSPAEGWAVGLYDVPGGTGAEHTLIEHWNGSTWSRVPSPSRSPLEGLFSVSAVSATDAWAVGGYFTGRGVFHSLILRWNGTTWSRVASPDPSPDPISGLNFLSGVTAVSATDAWAAGYFCVRNCQQDGKVDHTLILHWNGIAWSRVPSPNPGRSYSILNGVTAASGTDAWAAGTYAARAGHDTLILRWNGTAWSRVPSPNPHPSDNELTGVTVVSARNAWAAGFFCPRHCARSAEPDHTLILHWNGTTWSRVPSPNPSTNYSVLSGVTGVSARNSWAAGLFCVMRCAQVSPGSAHEVDHTLILRWNGTTWSRVPSPDPRKGGNDLLATSAISATGAWAVGFACAIACGNTSVFHPLILRWNGTTWSVPDSRRGWCPGAPGTSRNDALEFMIIYAYDEFQCTMLLAYSEFYLTIMVLSCLESLTRCQFAAGSCSMAISMSGSSCGHSRVRPAAGFARSATHWA